MDKKIMMIMAVAWLSIIPFSMALGAKIGENSITCVTCVGTFSQNDLEIVLDILGKNDNEALTQMVLIGKAVPIKKGTPVSVLDLTFSGKAKIRIKGSSDVLWVYTSWLE